MNRIALFAAGSALSLAATLFACGGSGDGNAAADASSDGTGDALASDGSTPIDDASALDGGGLLPLVFPTLPAGFPAHFSSLTAPAIVARLPDLCAIDTGNSSSMPTVTLCPKGSAPETSSPPNLMVVDAQNATVLWVASLDITHAVKVTGARSLAIVSAGELAVEGPIDVSAKGPASGPGALDDGGGVGGASPCDAGIGGAGAGGGFGGNGGASPALSGGMPYGEDAGAFVGGSRGGGSCAKAGGGGGALQLSSATSLLVLPAGSLRAAGGGGEGALNSTGGGGAGGTIFLESLAGFIVSADITANGGGGGGAPGKSGADGLSSQTPASGGFASDGGANGGNGAVAAIASSAGQVDGLDPNRVGSGGGAVGRIWLRSMKPPTGTPSFSPAPVVLSF